MTIHYDVNFPPIKLVSIKEIISYVDQSELKIISQFYNFPRQIFLPWRAMNHQRMCVTIKKKNKVNIEHDLKLLAKSHCDRDHSKGVTKHLTCTRMVSINTRNMCGRLPTTPINTWQEDILNSSTTLLLATPDSAATRNTIRSFQVFSLIKENGANSHMKSSNTFFFFSLSNIWFVRRFEPLKSDK